MSVASFQPGDLIGGRYRLNRLIGAGAMGAVWSARNESTDRDFALKLMLPDAAQNPVALQRFFQEAKASGRLRHRCIVEVYDLGRIEQLAGNKIDPRAGTPYLVMELLEGEPLDSVLRRVKTLPAGTALQLMADVALGLDVAHRQRIVHRDLKPGNLFLHRTLEGDIVPKILDFGISKLIGAQTIDHVATSAGTVLGSPAYMSPEQAAGELDVDGRSDVWSLGVILYKCLCGSVPFQAPNYNALMKAISTNVQQPIAERVKGLPVEVNRIVERCLSKDRDQRYASARALADEIQGVLDRYPMLPVVPLDQVVMLPIEMEADEIRTVGATEGERSLGGSLAATELADYRAPSNAPSTTPNPMSLGADTRETIRDAPMAIPKFRKRRPGVAILVTAVLVSLAVSVGLVAQSAKTPERTAAAPPPPPVVQTVVVREVVSASAPASTPSVQPSASASASAKAPPKVWNRNPRDQVRPPPKAAPSATVAPPPTEPASTVGRDF